MQLSPLQYTSVSTITTKPDHTLNNRQKKAGIALLLAFSCLAGIVLFFSFDPPGQHPRSTVNELDSLIFDEFNLFNLQQHHINERTLEVDSLFTRKIYEVGLPAGLSRTFVHTELARRVSDAGWDTRGTVSFPERSIQMDIVKENTLIRTVQIEQDTTSRRMLNPASILVYFDHAPSQNQLNTLESYGEPVGVLLRGSSPEQLTHRYEVLENYNYLTGFWPVDQTADAINNPHTFASDLRSVQSSPVMFSLSANVKETDETNINWIIAEDAEIAGSEHGREAFNRTIREFSNRAARGERPVLLINASEQTLQWLEDAIYNLKKGGLILTNPVLEES